MITPNSKVSWNGRHQQPGELITTQFCFSLSLIFTFTFITTDMFPAPYHLLFVYTLSQTLVSNNFPAFKKTSLISCWISSVQSPRHPQTPSERSTLQQFSSRKMGLNSPTASISSCCGCWKRLMLMQLAHEILRINTKGFVICSSSEFQNFWKSSDFLLSLGPCRYP